MNTAFPSKEGEIVPDATFLVRENHQLKAYTSDDIFKGKKVIAFSLPGAFTYVSKQSLKTFIYHSP